MKRILLLTVLLLPVLLMAQTDLEILQYSMLENRGTARFAGSGGAFTAVGGDFSSTSQNPAGLGLFRKSEFFVTPGFNLNSTQSQYFENSLTDDKLNFNLSGFGFAFQKNHYNSRGKAKSTGWVSSTFGVGYNRLANFNRKYQFQGVNPDNSLLDRYALDATLDATPPSQVFSRFPYGAGLAYEAYLIDPLVNDTTSYLSRAPYGGVSQFQDYSSRGSIDEWTLSYAANYGNRFFLGATVGISNLKYIQQRSYTERDAFDTIPAFDNFTLDERIETRGTGINLKVGLLAHVTNNIRVGAAIHTPTYFRLRDAFFSVMFSDVETNRYEIESPNGEFVYNVITPWRATLGVSGIFPQYGFISVDYEYVNYTAARFSTNAVGEEAFTAQLNNSINNKYQGVHTVRLGGEYVYDIFRLRGGVQFQTAALRDGLAPGNANYSSRGFSLGGGLRGETLYMDVAYVYRNYSDTYIPYTLEQLPGETVRGAILDNATHRLSVTMGVRF